MSDDYTNDIKWKKSIEINHTGLLNTRFTTVLKVAAHGTRLPTYLIFRKFANIPLIRVSRNIHIAISDSGFMDSELMEDYFERIFKPYLNVRKGLLVLDDYERESKG